MKLSTKHSPSKRSKGFTLVELLVVIAIIASLAGVSYGPIMRQLRNADVTKATKVCIDLVAAIDNFQLDYGSLPATSTSYPNDDELITTDDPAILEVLMGIDTDVNDRGISYFTADQAKGDRDGLIYNGNDVVSLVDKWENPFSIMLDYDADGKIDVSDLLDIDNPSDSDYEDDRRTTSAVVASPGKDGEFDGKEDSKSW